MSCTQTHCNTFCRLFPSFGIRLRVLNRFYSVFFFLDLLTQFKLIPWFSINFEILMIFRRIIISMNSGVLETLFHSNTDLIGFHHKVLSFLIRSNRKPFKYHSDLWSPSNERKTQIGLFSFNLIKLKNHFNLNATFYLHFAARHKLLFIQYLLLIRMLLIKYRKLLYIICTLEWNIINFQLIYCLKTCTKMLYRSDFDLVPN